MPLPDPEPPANEMPSSTMPPLAERYVLEEQLAKGGQGVVFRARDRQTGEPVIVKKLPPEQLASPQSVARFIREGEALRRLAHPNIVRMLDFVEHEGRYAIVMEYVPGGTLRALLDRQGPLPLPQLFDIALELADALGRSHHLGILHRDVKPENVLLTEEGAPRLTDFGAALLQSEDVRLTRTGASVGSPAYMSPEALRGEQLDTHSDVWSFGVMLYEMIAGRRPFVGDTATHVMVQILQQPAPDLSSLRPDLPPSLLDLVNAVLLKDRQQRLGSMRLIASALEAIRAGREPQGIPPSVVASEPRESQTGSRITTPPSIARHLPARAAPFIGREQELGELATLLADPGLRLLTILGPGGIGKTQLALQAARTIAPAFRDGVFFVPLAPLSAAEEIVFAIAHSVGVHFYRSSEARQQLFEYLQAKQLLLVLDNFEHVLDGATLVAEIVEAAPQVTLLVTSRASLNLSFQHLYTLGGLSYPDPATEGDPASYPAVQLLLQQARQVCPGLQPDDAEMREAARIAHLVQGMPLALVLAARWAELLPLKEIAGEIAQSLDFLDTTMRDLPPRQRSVRAVFDYSWQQLDPGIQEVFARLSVFRGGFTREAAAQVAGADLRALLELVRKSFVTSRQRDRYEVHELLRQYGEERLEASGNARSVCDAHSAYYLNFLASREQDVKGRRQVEALREIEADLQNVRRAWEWALRHRHRDAVDDALETLHLFCDMLGRHQEGIELFARAREALAPPADQDPDLLWGRIVTRHGFLQVLLPADAQAVESELQQGLAIARQHDDKYEIAIAIQALSTFAAVVQQDHQRATELSARAHELFQELGDDFFLARALVNLGISATPSDPSAFAAYVEEAVRVARAGGDIVDVSLGLANLTEYYVGMGRYDTAREQCIEAISLAGETDAAPIMAFCQAWLGCIDLLQGNLDAAEATLKESLSLAQDIHSLTALAYASGLSALAAALRGDYLTAHRLATESQDNPANNTLGLVITPWALSLAHYGQHDLPAARSSLREALQQARDLGFPAPPLWLLPVAALFLVEEEDQLERAVELLALSSTHPLSPRGWTNAWEPLRNLSERLKQNMGAGRYAAGWKRGEVLDLSGVVAQLLAHDP